MLKKITFLAVLALSMLYSCQTNDEFEVFQTNSYQFSVVEKIMSDLTSKDSESACYSSPLITNQNITVGSVNVEISTEEGVQYVYMTYTSNENWVIKLTHLYAGEKEGIYETINGNSVYGVFEEEMNFEENANSNFEVEYKIEAEALEQCFYVAAYVEVLRLDDKGNILESEIAWAEGEEFEEANQGMYFEFCKDTCELENSTEVNDNHNSCDSNHNEDGEYDEEEGDHHSCNSDCEEDDEHGNHNEDGEYDDDDDDDDDHHSCDSDCDEDDEHGNHNEDGEYDEDEGNHHSCDSDCDEDDEHGNHNGEDESYDDECNNGGATGGGSNSGGVKSTGGSTTGGTTATGGVK
ncbi:hypothetical protein [Lutibacter sp.]|uniref:hypothetical protein n=1 Tax=Lutibacter sp. TaxID=1925666 RepID=UPI0025C3CF02|nr:hypothetical protein [Lutibacter sp.]MCF6167975.1 hypothetical protein [Lutibacter sp.]